MLLTCDNQNQSARPLVAIRPVSAFRRDCRIQGAGASLNATMKKNTLETFWSRVNKNGSIPDQKPELGNCWEWTGTMTDKGYGLFAFKCKEFRAHRFSLKLTIGDFGKFCACHKCDNPKCIRPSHLFAATHSENMRDMANKKRAKSPYAESTKCIHGHEYKKGTFKIRIKGKYKSRRCLICDKIRNKARSR